MALTLDELVAAERDGAHFTVDGMPGVAFYLARVDTAPDEDTEWTGEEVATGLAMLVMVGDDREHVVDPADVSIVPAGGYCAECGQLGHSAEFE